MSDMASVTDAQWGAPGQLLMELAVKGMNTPWRDYVRGLEATNQVRFVQTGDVLETRKVYIDLLQPCKGPFRALDGQTAGSRNRYLAREDVPAAVWSAIVEHCACVDRETGLFSDLADLPCRRVSALGLSEERQAFAA